jgi:hypothetical protein
MTMYLQSKRWSYEDVDAALLFVKNVSGLQLYLIQLRLGTVRIKI